MALRGQPVRVCLGGAWMGGVNEPPGLYSEDNIRSRRGVVKTCSYWYVLLTYLVSIDGTVMR